VLCRDGNLQESSLSHGRGLLAQSDSAFNEATRRFPGKSIMVCKQCTAFGLTGIVEDDQQGDFHVWAFDTGSIVNNVRSKLILHHSTPYYCQPVQCDLFPVQCEFSCPSPEV
jgi:hypothetical protein